MSPREFFDYSTNTMQIESSGKSFECDHFRLDKYYFTFNFYVIEGQKDDCCGSKVRNLIDLRNTKKITPTD